MSACGASAHAPLSDSSATSPPLPPACGRLSAWTAELLSKSSGGAPLPLAAAAKAKETLGAVAADSSGKTSVVAGAFELPDGKKISVAPATRVAMAEPLFEPSMLGQAGGGLAQLVAECIRQRDRDGVLESQQHGKDGTDNWYRSVVLGGASTMFAGLGPRLATELLRSAPDGCVPEVLAVPERAHGAWLGGSILSSLAVMSTMWVSKADYDENGPLIVHRKVRRVACRDPERLCRAPEPPTALGSERLSRMLTTFSADGLARSAFERGLRGRGRPQ